MRRRFDYHSNPQYGWNTTSLEYVEHLTRMQRMPSVITDAPHFPYVDSDLQNKVIHEEESEDHHQQVNHHKHQPPEAKKKVQFTEDKKSTEVVKDGKGEVHVEKTDAPHFPYVHSDLQNKVIHEEESEDHHQQVNRHKHQAPEAKKKVQFAEDKKSAEVVKDGKGEVHVKKDINMEADGFIKQKHKNFELYK